jgi:hypothetical protein
MAVAFIMDFPGGSVEDYDWVVDRMQLNGRLPAGALIHASGQASDGLRVCDVWESADTFRQFADTKIGPLSTERGMAPPKIRSFEVEEIRRGTGDAVEFVQVVYVPGISDHATFVEVDRQIVGADRRAPDGCVFHVNGTFDAGYCVLDYWTSKEIRDAFIEQQVLPVFQKAGLATPTIEEMSVHNALTKPAAHHAGV